jgi:hypothetical protein
MSLRGLDDQCHLHSGDTRAFWPPRYGHTAILALVPEGWQFRLHPLQTYPRMALDSNLFAMKASERSGVWQIGLEEVKPL